MMKVTTSAKKNFKPLLPPVNHKLRSITLANMIRQPQC